LFANIAGVDIWWLTWDNFKKNLKPISITQWKLNYSEIGSWYHLISFDIANQDIITVASSIPNWQRDYFYASWTDTNWTNVEYLILKLIGN
jgi:hypothetical protein